MPDNPSEKEIMVCLTRIETKIDQTITDYVETMQEALKEFMKRGENIVRIEAKLNTVEGIFSSKLDNISNMISKVVYALLGIIASYIGVQFIPKSPVDWVQGIHDGTRFLTIFTLVFTSLRMWQTRKHRFRSRSFGCLIYGFTMLSLVMICIFLTPEADLYMSMLIYFRIVYIALFLTYSWNIEKINGLNKPYITKESEG